MLDGLLYDLRHSFRTLRRDAWFTTVAVVTLAIGIGANSAVFSVLNAVLLKPLPYPHADELVSVWHAAPGAAGLGSVSGDLRLSSSMFFTYSEQNRTFQSMGVWTAGTMTVTGVGEPEEVRTVYVSDGVLQALAIPPAEGRWLDATDQIPGGASVMLGYGYWQRRFGGDPGVVGRKIVVDSRPRQIAGVMPRDFRFVNKEADVIVPLGFERAKAALPGFGYLCVARLKPGVSIAKADADIARLVPVWMNSWPAAPGVNPRVYESWHIAPAIRPLKQDVVGNVGNVLWVLMGTIGIVLVIASANVANLLLVRAEGRQQELAVRAALGAGWARTMRQLLLESLTLGMMGGALGLALADAGLRFLVALGPASLPRLNEISIDGRALGFTLAVSLLSGLLFGLLPAVNYAGPRISLALRGGGRTLSQSRERHRARNILVVAQIALALVLLVSAGLMIRTFQALRRVIPGFTHASQIELARVSIAPNLVPDRERTVRMQNEIVEKLAAIPGVTSVAFASEMPMEGIPVDWDAIRVEGKPDMFAGNEIPPMRTFKRISPGLFQTQGTAILAGRDYTWTDIYDRRLVVMVSANLARELWGSPAAAIGRRIAASVPGASWREVIGVVEDVRDNGVQDPAPSIVYWPSYGESLYVVGRTEVTRSVTFAVHSSRAGSASLFNRLQQAVWSVNPSLPVASVRTMLEVYEASMARTSFMLVMLAIAAAMAMLLGVVGIYGVISYAVTQRRREIGIRLALGAQQRELRRMFVRHALLLAAIGVAAGAAAAIGLTRWMASLLFGISPMDPATYIVVGLVLALATATASYVPARRASAVDPVEALRAE